MHGGPTWPISTTPVHVKSSEDNIPITWRHSTDHSILKAQRLNYTNKACKGEILPTHKCTPVFICSPYRDNIIVKSIKHCPTRNL